jgi:hypothetical protein
MQYHCFEKENRRTRTACAGQRNSFGKTEALVNYWQRKVLKVTESVALRLPLTAFTTAVTFTSSG